MCVQLSLTCHCLYVLATLLLSWLLHKDDVRYRNAKGRQTTHSLHQDTMTGIKSPGRCELPGDTRDPCSKKLASILSEFMRWHILLDKQYERYGTKRRHPRGGKPDLYKESEQPVSK
jgi:hypothetical protein